LKTIKDNDTGEPTYQIKKEKKNIGARKGTGKTYSSGRTTVPWERKWRKQVEESNERAVVDTRNTDQKSSTIKGMGAGGGGLCGGKCARKKDQKG